MKLQQTGGSQCGKLRYEITEAPQLVYTCHCKDCQRLTGSAFAIGIVVPENGFRLSGIGPRPLRSDCRQRTDGDAAGLLRSWRDHPLFVDEAFPREIYVISCNRYDAAYRSRLACGRLRKPTPRRKARSILVEDGFLVSEMAYPNP
jgi:hypothetical protein